MTKKCVHHYLIPQGGVTVTGVCKLCGDKKEFYNSIPRISTRRLFVKKDKEMIQARREYYQNYYRII